jgi:hypothetical protein
VLDAVALNRYRGVFDRLAAVAVNQSAALNN